MDDKKLIYVEKQLKELEVAKLISSASSQALIK